MMTDPGTWKTVLILSHSLNTSRMLFLVPTDFSLWDVNPAASRVFERFSGHVRSFSSACVKDTGWLSSSGLYASSPATTDIWLCLEPELYSMLPSGSGTGRSEPWGIGLMTEGTSGNSSL